MLTLKQKQFIGTLIFFIIMLLFSNFYQKKKKQKEKDLYQNQRLSFCVPYRYEIEGSRTSHTLYIKYKLKSLTNYFDSRNEIKEKNIQLNHYYPVIYNRKDSLHSLLLINKKPIDPIAQIAKNSFEMYGKIDSCYNAYNSSETYISYTVNHQKYSFRTRIDSTLLPKKTISSSVGKKIKLKVSKTYFQLNNLYLLSYDRVPDLKKTYKYKDENIQLLY
ncbi:hypothetical protein [Wenyingzhuangia marina]|uniref:Uncharacterized protein n=1 Tax=Wenyingzhuangia marina TaxID=1195760 RepID=A0A1M5W1B5_9FLAO|nr:hypothetical protein [Wenyingzhuangia marina]GGF76535.1 hypothetical protein GCM10011397_19360 [Wenyingzhuangia marina]SHH81369.1 hypothetical protein SAMN05444281_2129 [Wenyingzhuangia marina]